MPLLTSDPETTKSAAALIAPAFILKNSNSVTGLSAQGSYCNLI